MIGYEFMLGFILGMFAIVSIVKLMYGLSNQNKPHDRPGNEEGASHHEDD